MAEPGLFRLIDLWYQLEPREKSVLLRITQRLLDGQTAYGPLTAGKKNWRKEAQEEAMDMCVYLSALLEDSNEDS